MKQKDNNNSETMRPAILKDLCFLTGVLCPILALILNFVIKDDVYTKIFRISMVYGFALWTVVGLMIGLNMCDADIGGVSNLK